MSSSETGTDTTNERSCAACSTLLAEEDLFCPECGTRWELPATDETQPTPLEEQGLEVAKAILPAGSDRPSRPGWALPVAIVVAGVLVLIAGLLVFASSKSDQQASSQRIDDAPSAPREAVMEVEDVPEPEEIPAPPIEEAPVESSQLQTSVGVLEIESVEIRENYVECPVGTTNCKNVSGGRPILVLVLEGPAGTTSGSLIEALSAEIFQSQVLANGAVAYGTNVNSRGGSKIEVIYSYVNKGSQLILEWPGNPRILLPA